MDWESWMCLFKLAIFSRVQFIAYLALLGVYLILLGVALAGLAVAVKKRDEQRLR
jgi:hypothetical protein